jgi:hypothetical protein
MTTAELLTITSAQRDALRDLMAHRLFMAGDRRLKAALAQGISHDQLAAEFADDLRLMQVLGWDRHKRGDVVLTMPSRPLELTLRRMRFDAVEAQAEDVPPQRPDETQEERAARFQLAERTCDELLSALD